MGRGQSTTKTSVNTKVSTRGSKVFDNTEVAKKQPMDLGTDLKVIHREVRGLYFAVKNPPLSIRHDENEVDDISEHHEPSMLLKNG